MDDPMQDRDNWGWQATARTVRDRTTYLWKHNLIPFNVTFEVGPKGQKEIVGAHKDVLAISSEVYCSMFYGPVAKPRDPNDRIVDDDIDPQAFRLMLKYIYTESLADDDEYRSEPFPTGVELAFKTMQAAGKYGIPALYLFCRNYILNDIQKTFKTSKSVAEDGMLYALYARNSEWHNKVIIEAVWREIDAFAEEVLHVPDQVLQIVDEALMVEFLSRTSLNVTKEITLYKFAVRWARLQQEGPRKDESLKSVMEKLGEVLLFSSMSVRDWLDGPLKDGLYTLDDLRNKAISANGTTMRCRHDSPSIIRFDMCETEYDEEGDIRKTYLGQLQIQTETEYSSVLTRLVEKCVRKQMESTDRSADLFIELQYMGFIVTGEGVDKPSQIDLSQEEQAMLVSGGRVAAQMKLGLGDVAVGFTLASQGGFPDDKLWNMYLIFGDGSRRPVRPMCHWPVITEIRLFYLGRLNKGQDILDKWHQLLYDSIVYNLKYEKKTLDAP